MNFSYLIDLTNKTNQYILLENKIDTWKIGRNQTNNIIIGDKRVSRNHALLLREKQKYYLVDLNSKNGTYLNGYRISDRRAIQTGDFVKIGRTRLQFINYSSCPMKKDLEISRDKMTMVFRLAAQLSTSTPERLSSEKLMDLGLGVGIKPEHMYQAIVQINRESSDKDSDKE